MQIKPSRAAITGSTRTCPTELCGIGVQKLKMVEEDCMVCQRCFLCDRAARDVPFVIVLPEMCPLWSCCQRCALCGRAARDVPFVIVLPEMRPLRSSVPEMCPL